MIVIVKPKNGEICYDPDLYNEGDEGGPICLTIDKVEDQFFKTEFIVKLPQMEFEEVEQPVELPPELKLPELPEEDSFNPDSWTHPPFIPKGLKKFYLPQPS